MRRRLLAALALFTLALLALGTTVGSAQTVTIGQTLPGSGACATAWFVQTSPASYAVPAGNGISPRGARSRAAPAARWA